MEQWLIHSNLVNCVQYDRNPKNIYDLEIKVINQNYRKIFDRVKDDDRQVLELDFGNNPDKLKRQHLDMYDRVQLGLSVIFWYLNWVFASSHSISSAYQKWPTRDLHLTMSDFI